MKTKTAMLTLAIALSFAGLASAQDAASTTTTTDTTVVTTTAPAAAPAVTPEATTPATSPMSELDMRTSLTAQGYTNIEDLKFKDGMWTAEAKSADGNKVDLKIDGVTGKAIPDETVSKIDKDAVIAALLAAKYTNPHDVKFEDGIWTADARDSSGAEVEVKLDATDGHILGSEKEEADANEDANEDAADAKEDAEKKN
jgi:uncharacterized protein with FMN-binding domain